MTASAYTGRLRKGFREALPYVIGACAVWLAWHVVQQPIIDRAPPQAAVRIAPASAVVLRRAAEAELLADRPDNARDLAGIALDRSPFDVRALRVYGLATSTLGDRARANEVLTLAGNLSLRDDPTHAWLIEQRLRQGNYASAFAHADTLARRRQELHPRVFQLFTAAAVEDPRAVPALARVLAARPPWRQPYLYGLNLSRRNTGVQANLAILLQRSANPLTTEELEQMYMYWLGDGRVEALRTVRDHLRRPPPTPVVANPTFEGGREEIAPFGWMMATGSGYVAEISQDPDRAGQSVLQVNYDGYSQADYLAQQLLMLTPGSYRLVLSSRTDAAPSDGLRLSWSVVCYENHQVLADVRPAASSAWRSEDASFAVPSAGCTAQWLRLNGRPEERRATVAASFDDILLTPN
jgi:hypothetical protein